MYEEMFIDFIAKFLRLSYSMIMESNCKLDLKLMVRYPAFKENEVFVVLVYFGLYYLLLLINFQKERIREDVVYAVSSNIR